MISTPSISSSDSISGRDNADSCHRPSFAPPPLGKGVGGFINRHRYLASIPGATDCDSRDSNRETLAEFVSRSVQPGFSEVWGGHFTQPLFGWDSSTFCGHVETHFLSYFSEACNSVAVLCNSVNPL